MSFTIADQYYLKAYENYPYDYENVVENLSYALSYDESHARANHLMGCVQMYILKEFKSAKDYFEQALIGDLDFPDTYKNYSKLLIWIGEFEKAEKLIRYGLTVKGMDKKALLVNKASIYEVNGQLKVTKKILKLAKAYCFDESNTTHIDKELSRIKKKMKKDKRKKVSVKDKRVSAKKLG